MKDDLIKRSDAIKDLCDITDNSDMPEDWHRGLSVALSALYRVPSADRPQGEWIRMKFTDRGSPIDKCSNCGHYINGDVEVRNYCPNCGARMRPRLQGKHFDSIIIDESAMKGADDE